MGAMMIHINVQINATLDTSEEDHVRDVLATLVEQTLSLTFNDVTVGTTVS